MQVRLKKFDPGAMSKNCTVLLNASRRSGKSFLTRDLLYHMQDVPVVLCLSGTEKYNRFYGDIVPESLIYDEYTPELMEKILKRQKRMTARYNREVDETGEAKTDPRIVVVADDVMHNNAWTRDKSVMEIFLAGRHIHITFILISQFAYLVPPVLRANLDYVILFKEPVRENRVRLYKSYCGAFNSYDVFEQVLNAVTNDYGTLVVDNTCNSTNVFDIVSWYRAEPRSGFQTGSRKLWQRNAERVRAPGGGASSSDEEDYDPSVTDRKRSITVKREHVY